MPAETTEYFEGMMVGKGYDTVTDDAKISPAVTGNLGTIEGGEGEQGISLFIEVNTSDEFEEVLDVKAKASYGVFSGASAKFNYKKACRVSKQSKFIMVIVSKTKATETFSSDISLTESAEDLLRVGNTERFHQRFGDRFISGITLGGDFFGTVRIEAETYERQREIAGKIKGNYALFRSSGSVNHQEIEEIERERIEILCMQNGGEVETITKLEEFFALAKAMPQDISNSQAVPLKAILEQYTELELPHDNVSFVQRQVQREVIRDLGRKYRSLSNLREEVEYVLRNPDYFESFNESELARNSQELAEMLNEIADAADSCVRDASMCQQYERTTPAVNIPNRRRGRRPSSPGPVVPPMDPVIVVGSSQPYNNIELIALQKSRRIQEAVTFSKMAKDLRVKLPSLRARPRARMALLRRIENLEKKAEINLRQ